MEGFTYLLTDGNAYKIGMTTRTVQERVKELNSSTSSYAKIKIVAYCETSNCRATETKLHKKYDRERITPKREWFMLTEDQVIEIQTFFVIQAEGDLYAPDTPEHEEIKRLEEIRRETARLVKEAAKARERAARIEREEKQAATQAAAMKVWEEEAPKRKAADRKKKTIEALLVWAVIIIGIIVYNMYPDQGFMALTIFFTLMIFPYPLMALEKIIYYCIDKIKTR